MFLKHPVRRAAVAVGLASFLTMSLGAANAARADGGNVTTTMIPQSAEATSQLPALVVSKPTAPRSPKAVPGNASVRLAWLAPSSNGGVPIGFYAVQRSTNGTTWATIAKPAGTAYTATGLKNGARYYFRVRAHNVAGLSAASAVVSAVPRTKPSAPRSPAATPSIHAVTLYWTKPKSNGGATIDKYAVQRYAAATKQWKTIASTTTTSFKVTGLITPKTSSFRVVAHNAAGFGAPSMTVDAAPLTHPSAPRSPLATPGNTSVKLTWAAPANDGGLTIDHYKVQRYAAATKQWLIVAKPAGTSSTATGLKNGTKYSFRIVAHNAAGDGPASATVSAVPRTSPSAPQSLVATPGVGTVALNWNAPASNGGAAIDKYRVEVSENNGPFYVAAETTTRGYTFQKDPGTYLMFRIRAHNAAGWSGTSNWKDGIPYTVPTAPQNCSVSKFGSQTIHAQWNPPSSDGYSPITNYRFEVRLNGYLVKSELVPANPTDYYSWGWSTGVTYDVTLTAVNKAGDGFPCTKSILFV